MPRACGCSISGCLAELGARHAASCGCRLLGVACGPTCACHGACFNGQDGTRAPPVMSTFRDSPIPKANDIWTYRGDVDVYTALTRVGTHTAMHRDHVIEVQLADATWFPRWADEAAPPGDDAVRRLFTSVPNFNMTPRTINLAKGAVFAHWRSRCFGPLGVSGFSADDAYEAQYDVLGLGRELPPSVWSAIKCEIVTTWTALDTCKYDVCTSERDDEGVDLFMEALNELLILLAL